MRVWSVLAGACVLLAAAGCSNSASRVPALPYAAAPSGSHPEMPIQHVVVIVQENRTFNSIFAGYPGARTSFTATTSTGTVIPVTPIAFNDSHGDLGHSFALAVTAWDGGKMDRFDENFISKSGLAAGYYPYSYVEHRQTRPYWKMAKQYVLDDAMFPTEWGSSFTGHQDLISGTTELSASTSVADNPFALPWGCGAPVGTRTNAVKRPAGGSGPGTVIDDGGPFPCYNHVTMADALDEKGVSWKYYAPSMRTNIGGRLWSAFSAIRAVYDGPDWKNVQSPPTNVLRDIRAGSLPAVSWVIPDFRNSDHPAAFSKTGPAWVATVVDAIGESRYWKSTAIVVVWDDYGGWYDPVPPPQLDYLGLAIRVPCIVISPYSPAGVVDHTQYEFGSILKTIEQIFALHSMGTTDVRAHSMLGDFNFKQTPRPFVPISHAFSERYFLTQPPSGLPPDND